MVRRGQGAFCTILTNTSKPRSVPVISLSPFMSTQMGLPMHLSISSAGMRWLGLPPYWTCSAPAAVRRAEFQIRKRRAVNDLLFPNTTGAADQGWRCSIALRTRGRRTQ